MKKLGFFFIILILASFVLAEEITFSPSTIGEMTAQVKVFGSGGITGLKTNQQVKMQVLTFQKTAYQEIEIIRENVFINDKAIPANSTYDEFNNKYAEFIIPENGEFTYELIAKVTTKSLIHEISDYDLTNKIIVGGDYLIPSPKVESDSSEIATLSANKFTKTSFIETLNDTVSWVNDYVEYATGPDFQKYYILQQSALETLKDKKGVCDEFANLGAAILRSKGIPTRLAIGITFDGREWGNHAWIEVYQPEIGWIPSDPTFRESGFVDATHIKMGSFSDVSLSLAKAIFPSNASVTFGPPTLPEVIIIEKKYFDAIELDAKAPTLLANQWNTLTVDVKNKTNMAMTVPVTLNENYQEIYVKTPRLDLALKSGETKQVEFELYPNVELEANQIATGEGIRINSLGTPIELDFQIKSAPGGDTGTVAVTDITPIVSGTNLEIETTVANYSPSEQEITIKIFGDGANINETIKLEPFSFSNRITKTIESFEEKIYTIEITTPSTIYTQNINPIKPIAGQVVIRDQNTETTVTQRVDTTKTNNDFSFDMTLENPLVILMLVMLLMVMVLVTAYYFSKKARYV